MAVPCDGKKQRQSVYWYVLALYVSRNTEVGSRHWTALACMHAGRVVDLQWGLPALELIYMELFLVWHPLDINFLLERDNYT